MKQLIVLFLATFFPKVLKGKSFMLFNQQYVVDYKLGKTFFLIGPDVQNPKRISGKDLAFASIKYDSQELKDRSRLTRIYNEVNEIKGYYPVLEDRYISGGAYYIPLKHRPIQLTCSPELSYNDNLHRGVIKFQEINDELANPLATIVSMVKNENIASVWGGKIKVQLTTFLRKHLGDEVQVRVNKAGQTIASGNGMFFMFDSNGVKFDDLEVVFNLGPTTASGKYGTYYTGALKQRLYIGNAQKRVSIENFVEEIWTPFTQLMALKADNFHEEVTAIKKMSSGDSNHSWPSVEGLKNYWKRNKDTASLM